MKKSLVILGLVLIFASGSFAQETSWSEPVKGLRARLLVLTSDKPDSPFYRVWIEMQNVSNTGGQMKIRFDPDRIVFRVTDKTDKKPLQPSSPPWDGERPLWEPTLLPWTGTMKFQISFPGAGYRPSAKAIIDIGPGKTWIIPDDGKSYFLSGNLTIERKNGDHSYTDWSGTLELPAVEIPVQK